VITFHILPRYIRRDIDGSSVVTRRRAVCDLTKAFCMIFERSMTDLLGKYVQIMLEGYASNPDQLWRCKVNAIYLIIALASKGSTARHRRTLFTNTTFQLVDLVEFFGTHILPELQNPAIDRLPVLKADAIK
jgi:exportin-2 (importin alpha re-exporter)